MWMLKVILLSIVTPSSFKSVDDWILYPSIKTLMLESCFFFYRLSWHDICRGFLAISCLCTTCSLFLLLCWGSVLLRRDGSQQHKFGGRRQILIGLRSWLCIFIYLLLFMAKQITISEQYYTTTTTIGTTASVQEKGHGTHAMEPETPYKANAPKNI